MPIKVIMLQDYKDDEKGIDLKKGEKISRDDIDYLLLGHLVFHGYAEVLF